MTNSINTNVGAMVALQSLNHTSSDLQATQKRISTGFRVADAQDDGAAFAVALKVRSDISATASANEQLGNAKGLLSVTNAALSGVSGLLDKYKTIALKMADKDVNADQFKQYQSQITEVYNNMEKYVTGANYNGTNLIKSGSTDIDVIEDSDGNQKTLKSYDAKVGILDSMKALTTAADATATKALLGSIDTAIKDNSSQLNQMGSYSNYVDNQINYNKSIMDAQTSGLGALVDADMSKEAANLQALQVRQQLGTQALSMANQAPQALLSLFRG